MAKANQQEGLFRNAFDQLVHDHWDAKRSDVINIGLGKQDGYYHHHFAVGDFDHAVLGAPPGQREDLIAAEMHRMETDQVAIIVDSLTGLTSSARVLDAGSGRGGTCLLLHRAFGCQVDGVNFCGHHNEFARRLANERGVADHVRFHDRNMIDTGCPDETFDAVVTNETTMYVDLADAFTEFARVLKPGGRYVLITWCVNDAVAAAPPEAAAIDDHYVCHTHQRSAYLGALLDAGLTPYQVDDFTTAAIPYWELRSRSELATGVEKPFLDGYRSNRVNYIRIVTRKGM